MIPLSSARAVTFDCWNTLIHEPDASASIVVRVQAVRDATGLDEQQATTLLTEAWAAHVEAWQRHEQMGTPGIAAYIAERHRMSSAARAELELRLAEGAGLDAIEAVPGAQETLERLKAAGFATALVCDTGMRPGEVVRRVLDAHGLSKLLDTLVFSDEVGVPKPERVMFSTALGAIGGGPAAHVGDLRRTDIAGARAAGLAAVRFRGIYDDPSEHPEADVVIDDLRELPELLGA